MFDTDHLTHVLLWLAKLPDKEIKASLICGNIVKLAFYYHENEISIAVDDKKRN